MNTPASAYVPSVTRPDHELWMSWGLVGAAAALTVWVLVSGKRVEIATPPPSVAVKVQAAPAAVAMASAALAPVAAGAAPAAAQVSSASAPKASPTAEPQKAAAVQMVASAPAVATAPKEGAAPAGAASASRRWLLGLPPASWVVVHAQKASLREADAFRSGQSQLANARILQTSGPQGQYLVVTGPFRSPERAKNYIQRLDWKASARGVGRDELLTQVPR